MASPSAVVPEHGLAVGALAEQVRQLVAGAQQEDALLQPRQRLAAATAALDVARPGEDHPGQELEPPPLAGPVHQELADPAPADVLGPAEAQPGARPDDVVIR